MATSTTHQYPGDQTSSGVTENSGSVIDNNIGNQSLGQEEEYSHESPPQYTARKDGAPVAGSQGIISHQQDIQPVVRNEQSANPAPKEREHRQLVQPINSLKMTPAWIDCPKCQKPTLTAVDKHMSDMANMWVIILCLCAGVVFAWIPCVMDDCKDSTHTCSVCRSPIAEVTSHGVKPLGQGRMVPSQYAAVPQMQYPPKAMPQPQAERHGVAGGGGRSGDDIMDMQDLHGVTKSTQERKGQYDAPGASNQQPFSQDSGVIADGRM